MCNNTPILHATTYCKKISRCSKLWGRRRAYQQRLSVGRPAVDRRGTTAPSRAARRTSAKNGGAAEERVATGREVAAARVGSKYPVSKQSPPSPGQSVLADLLVCDEEPDIDDTYRSIRIQLLILHWV
ncbi:hypothetical protein MSG28_009906 [Choristoneura fumiferana]|uniref:Uncharacterized protein n=1 Tax=Choristoneura fumiferana TaxID=7141 RepID=A0ACC0JCY2_CHOFU|nr:hypothetical protein MSG28_009906 [Choristoneura fumiferana]